MKFVAGRRHGEQVRQEMADAAAGESHSPLAQFMIKKIMPFEVGGVDVSYTNSALAMTVAVIAVSIFLIFGMRRGACRR